jgi:hypothetical protein
LIFWRLGFCLFVRLLGFFYLDMFFGVLFSIFLLCQISLHVCLCISPMPPFFYFLWANAFLFIILNLIRKGTYQLIWGFFLFFSLMKILKLWYFSFFLKMYMIDSFQITTIFFLYDNLGFFFLEKQSKSSFIRIS